MAGGLMMKPQGRVTLTPLGLSQVMAARRGDKPKASSKRAIAAGLRAQQREEAALAAQRPMLDRVGFNSFLRTGSL